jgi:hypothetical protein
MNQVITEIDKQVPDLFSDLLSADQEAGENTLALTPEALMPAVAIPAEVAETQPESVDQAKDDDGPGFTRYWREYMQAVKAAEEQIDALVKSSEGRLMTLRGYRIGERISASAMLRQTRKEIQAEVYARAEREFAPQSGSLSIPRYEHEELLGENWDSCADEAFDPEALWKALVAKYGGQYGVELGLKQLAEKLVNGFGLRRNKPVRKANHLEVIDVIHCEKQYNGKMELSYSSAQSVSQLHNAMSAFCQWAKDLETARRIDARARDLMMNRDRTVVSRSKFEMGGVSYTMFFKNMTWEIHGELADHFQAFIGRYGREALASN